MAQRSPTITTSPFNGSFPPERMPICLSGGVDRMGRHSPADGAVPSPATLGPLHPEILIIGMSRRVIARERAIGAAAVGYDTTCASSGVQQDQSSRRRSESIDESDPKLGHEQRGNLV